jgi:uncharacterized protein YjiK
MDVELLKGINKGQTILKLSFAIFCFAVILFLWRDIKGVASSISGEPKALTESTTPASNDLRAAGIIVTQRWDLPEILKEISDISYLGESRFACIQDELGTIFIYNTSSSKVEQEIAFGAPGDYEGITLVNDVAWVVRSDGKLFEISGLKGSKPSVKEYSTHLTSRENVEGICYDAANNRLLLAIKDGEPGHEYKGVYGFDLNTRKMPAAPVFRIDLNNKVFNNGNKKSGGIMPSSIAIHPVTNDIYITDGRNSKLLVINASGEIKNLYQLDRNEFEQPEGITFKPDGEAYISNEGKKSGNILKVEIR